MQTKMQMIIEYTPIICPTIIKSLNPLVTYTIVVIVIKNMPIDNNATAIFHTLRTNISFWRLPLYLQVKPVFPFVPINYFITILGKRKINICKTVFNNINKLLFIIRFCGLFNISFNISKISAFLIFTLGNL